MEIQALGRSDIAFACQARELFCILVIARMPLPATAVCGCVAKRFVLVAAPSYHFADLDTHVVALCDGVLWVPSLVTSEIFTHVS